MELGDPTSGIRIYELQALAVPEPSSVLFAFCRRFSGNGDHANRSTSTISDGAPNIHAYRAVGRSHVDGRPKVTTIRLGSLGGWYLTADGKAGRAP